MPPDGMEAQPSQQVAPAPAPAPASAEGAALTQAPAQPQSREYGSKEDFLQDVADTRAALPPEHELYARLQGFVDTHTRYAQRDAEQSRRREAEIEAIGRERAELKKESEAYKKSLREQEERWTNFQKGQAAPQPKSPEEEYQQKAIKSLADQLAGNQREALQAYMVEHFDPVVKNLGEMYQRLQAGAEQERHFNQTVQRVRQADSEIHSALSVLEPRLGELMRTKPNDGTVGIIRTLAMNAAVMHNGGNINLRPGDLEAGTASALAQLRASGMLPHPSPGNAPTSTVGAAMSSRNGSAPPPNRPDAKSKEARAQMSAIFDSAMSGLGLE